MPVDGHVSFEILSVRGMIRKIEHSATQMRFDGDLSDHCRVRCGRCDRLNDVPGRDLAGLEEVPEGLSKNEPCKGGADSLDYRHQAGDEGLSRVRGYDIIGRRIEFFGVCPECRAADGRSGSD